MTAPLGIALLGCAHPHLPDAVGAIEARADVELAAAWDPEPERARPALDAGARLAADPAEALEGAGAAIILSETSRHDELLAEVLRRRLPVFVEKPLAIDGPRARSLAREIGESGATFHTGYFLREVPAHRAVREHLSRGRFGAPLRAAAHFGHPGLRLGWIDASPWLRDPALAGFGGFGDLGIHLLDLLGWLAGEQPAVAGGHLNPAPSASALETHGVALLRFPGGWSATVSAGWTDPVMRSSLEIAGTEASVRIVDGAVVDASGALFAADFPPPRAPAAAAALEPFFDAVLGGDRELALARDAARHCELLEEIRGRASS